MSQPALSNSIALLEQRLGVRVFDRSRRGSMLTPYGEILVRRARGVGALLADAESEVRLCGLGRLGPLRIAVTPSVASTLVPRAIASLTNDVGPVNIEVIDGLDETFKAMLQSGSVDVVVGPVGGLFGGGPNVVETALLEDPLMLAVGPESPLRHCSSLSLADLTDVAWVLPREGSGFRSLIEALFRSNDVQWPSDAIFTNTPATAERIVSLTQRVTIVTPVQLGASTDVTLLELVEAGARMIGVKTRADVPVNDLGQRFIDHVRRVCRPTGDPVSG